MKDLKPGETYQRNEVQDAMVEDFFSFGGHGYFLQWGRGRGHTTGIMSIAINSMLNTHRPTTFISDERFDLVVRQLHETALYHFDRRVKFDYKRREMKIGDDVMRIVIISDVRHADRHFRGMKVQDVFGELKCENYDKPDMRYALECARSRLGREGEGLGSCYLLLR